MAEELVVGIGAQQSVWDLVPYRVWAMLRSLLIIWLTM